MGRCDTSRIPELDFEQITREVCEKPRHAIVGMSDPDAADAVYGSRLHL